MISDLKISYKLFALYIFKEKNHFERKKKP